jgi:signal transduction histidine kinase
MMTALLSSALANFLFTEPRGVFQIRNTEDLCALVLFVFVSAVFGILAEISIRTQAELRVAEQQKDDFLALLAHELRNPLAIIHYTNLAEDRADHVSGLGRAEIIDRQVQQLDQMIEDLLDISKVSRGKFRIECEVVDVSALVSDALKEADRFIKPREHRLEVEGPPEGLKLWGDPIRLEQVITNLLTNAARYTPKGGKILFQITEENGRLLMRIRDNGRGIAREMVSRIFDLQTQVARALDESGPSLGVGLALVRTLVELHGGTVSATSEGPDRGSEFTVRLPLYTPHAEPIAEPAT